MGTREGLLGKKVGMSRVFDERGQVVPVTVIEAGPCYVTQIKNEATDGYNAIQLGFGAAKRLNKPERGHVSKATPVKHLHEVRTDDTGRYTLGQTVNVGVFKAGDLVDVIGLSRGRGFAGVMKRHGFAGGPATRGQSDRQRHTGSIGTTNTPGWVEKGRRMPGHMGNARCTVMNLRVVLVDAERNLLAVEGGVPGAPDGLLYVRRALKVARVPKAPAPVKK